MKNSYIRIVCVFAVAMLWVGALGADPKSQIGQQGDEYWNSLTNRLRSEGTFIDLVSTPVIVKNYQQYDRKLMRFPAIDFGNLITDRQGNRYYWYGEAGTDNLFVIRHSQAIQDQLYRLNNALGGVRGEYEVIGRIIDAFGWWGNVVLMETVAMRIPGVATVVVENGTPRLIAQQIMDNYMATQASNWASGIPRAAKAVPAGLAPEAVAKWFLVYGSVEKNQAVWAQLLSLDDRAVDANGNLQARGRSWWGMVSNADREYYFVRENTDRASDTSRVFMYQFRQGGADVGAARPMTVSKERNGEWRVTSF